jgi:sigma-B regulation protein RsbU (phosphoserine phosphatase)
LFETTTPERYATVFYGVYDPLTSTLTYANAGHYSPWLLSHSSEVRLDSLTAPVAMFAELPPAERVIRLSPGDWLVLVSDGIPEARNEIGDEFGDARLLALLDRSRMSALAFCNETIEAVTAFSRNHPVDDLTLLAARVLPAPDHNRTKT